MRARSGVRAVENAMAFVNENDPTLSPPPPAAPRASASSARVRSSACSLPSLLMSPASEASAAGLSAPSSAASPRRARISQTRAWVPPSRSARCGVSTRPSPWGTSARRDARGGVSARFQRISMAAGGARAREIRRRGRAKRFDAPSLRTRSAAPHRGSASAGTNAATTPSSRRTGRTRVARCLARGCELRAVVRVEILVSRGAYSSRAA